MYQTMASSINNLKDLSVKALPGGLCEAIRTTDFKASVMNRQKYILMHTLL